MNHFDEFLVYREFTDDEFEIGVMTYRHGRWVVEVDDFIYFFKPFDTDYLYTIIGKL